jgi:AraC-like DNA-binding protein
LVSHLREFLLKDNYFAKFDIDIQELIPEMATNRTSLFEAIKAVTGKTPMEYINSLRLEEAKRLLDDSNLTIETIAFECGFNTARTFYRQFREKYRISPTEYRNIAKNQG